MTLDDFGGGPAHVYNLPSSQQLVHALPTTPNPMPLLLASQSRIRWQLLTNAGLTFDTDAADIDERAVAASIPGPSREIAKGLAVAKALHVAARHPGALVIGADQMLELDGHNLSKAADAAAGRAALMRLRGRTHHLHSGVALAHGDQVLWSHVDSAAMHVRDFSDGWLDAYLAACPESLTTSVGAYQLEGPGVQLFERIEGDYFTILGLPLLPLLAALREHGVLPS